MTVIDSVPIDGLTRQDFTQLAYYIDEGRRNGYWYGRKDYFDKRHEKLSEWVDMVLTYTAGEKIKGKTNAKPTQLD